LPTITQANFAPLDDARLTDSASAELRDVKLGQREQFVVDTPQLYMWMLFAQIILRGGD